MKHTHLLYCLLSAVLTHAQVPCPENPPYTDWAYHAMAPLDKSQVPTGLLYENVFPYAELYLSHFNNSGKEHYLRLYDRVQDFHPDSKYHHPIGLIDYDFNTIDPEAVDDNLLSVANGQLHDVAGRPRSPYLSEHAAMAALLMAESYPCLYPGQHHFTFKQDFVLSNTGFSLADVTHLTAVWNNALIKDTPVNGLQGYVLNLTATNEDRSGTLALILTVGGQQLHYFITMCQVAVEPITECRGKYSFEVTGRPLDGGYGEGSYSEKGKATVYYSELSCQDRRIRRPLVFVDGFDPGNKQHHGEIWEKYLNSVYDVDNGQDAQLGDSLLSRGHDIIILDQLPGGSDGKKYNRGGTGLIENNAMVLVSLLEKIWARYNYSMEEEIVVVVASMGGMVARYALAWMEVHNIDHHTRLFVSFDSPQNGAQMPIGLQQTVDHFIRFGSLSLFPSIRNSLHLSNAA